MARTTKSILVGLVLVVAAGIGLVLTGQLGGLLFWYYVTFNGPDHAFDPGLAVPAPDYADPGSWAALPTKDDASDLLPEGVEVPFLQGEALVDVFFIHPTGYLSGESWTSPLERASTTEENTTWMMANQASAFNGCCNVYAPRYREASIFAYLGERDVRDEVVGFAYQDVARAFDYYLEQHNQGRPFVLAGHSQGAHHGERLIREKVDGTTIADQMVAAYLIGSLGASFSAGYLAALADVSACESPVETGCIVHWDTYGDGGEEPEFTLGTEPSLCTNPLSWTATTERINADRSRGAVPTAGTLTPTADQAPTGQAFNRLEQPVANYTWAQCRDHRLYVADQASGMYSKSTGGGPAKSYHVLDFQLFHMDIRENAARRVSAFMASWPGSH